MWDPKFVKWTDELQSLLDKYVDNDIPIKIVRNPEEKINELKSSVATTYLCNIGIEDAFDMTQEDIDKYRYSLPIFELQDKPIYFLCDYPRENMVLFEIELSDKVFTFIDVVVNISILLHIIDYLFKDTWTNKDDIHHPIFGFAGHFSSDLLLRYINVYDSGLITYECDS